MQILGPDGFKADAGPEPLGRWKDELGEAAGCRGEVKVDADGWTARTKDGSLSAHFEFSVAVTQEGARVLGTASAATG